MKIARQVFNVLMVAYPRRFRLEYGSLMLKHFSDTNTGGIRYWIWMMRDTASGASREHLAELKEQMSKEWREKMSKLALLAAALLVVPFGFVLLNLLQYQLGIPVPWNPFNNVYDQISGTSWRYLFDAVMVFSPVAALMLVFFSQVRISVGQDEAVLARVEIQMASRLAYIVVGSSLAVLGVMGLYLAAENLPCLLGQQITC